MSKQITFDELQKFLKYYYTGDHKEDDPDAMGPFFLQHFKIKAPPKNIEVFGPCYERQLEKLNANTDNGKALAIICQHFTTP